MKLVYRILLHLSWALSLLLAAWAVLFYFTLIDEINDEVDDALEARAEVIVKRVLAGANFPSRRTRATTATFCTRCRPNMLPHSTTNAIPTRRFSFPSATTRSRPACCARCSVTVRGNGAN